MHYRNDLNLFLRHPKYNGIRKMQQSAFSDTLVNLSVNQGITANPGYRIINSFKETLFQSGLFGLVKLYGLLQFLTRLRMKEKPHK
jgi:hypothetical protein